VHTHTRAARKLGLIDFENKTKTGEEARETETKNKDTTKEKRDAQAEDKREVEKGDSTNWRQQKKSPPLMAQVWRVQNEIGHYLPSATRRLYIIAHSTLL
jgi:hypothetical protein